MWNVQKLIRFLAIIFFGLIITLSLANKTGKTIEKFETKIYQKISGKKPQHFQFDSTGVPYVVFEGKLNIQYTTVSVAEHAIKWSDEKENKSARNFISCINWLIKNNRILNDSSIIFFDYFDWPSYKMTSPWRSAMNQGRAMQAFIKAYERNNDPIYLDYARRSMNTLYTEVKDGGVTYKDSLGYWYEEYADDNVPQSRVLNGMIVVLQALSDFHELTKDSSALFLFNKGVEATKNTLCLFDNTGHSNYDVLGKPANPWYHKFHIELLDFLYTETHEPIFNEYKQKWMKYKEPSYLENLFQKPNNISVFTLLTLFASVIVILFFAFYFLWWKH
jgi:heparosan-N-sulfate-glucuronate 5-epimerase